MEPHPLLAFSAIVLTSASVVGCTPPNSHVLRAGAFLLIALCTWHCITTAKDVLIRNPWASTLGGYSVTLLFHYIDIALLGKWSFHQQPLQQQLITGFSLTLNTRFIGTSQQVKRVPRTRANLSRKPFLWRTGILVLISYLTLDAMDSNADPDMTARYMSASNVPVLRRLYRHEMSGEEVMVRVLSVVGLGIGLVAVQGGSYLLLAFASVLCRLSSPQDFPPFYGSISDAYTLRRLWRYTFPPRSCLLLLTNEYRSSHAWHQLNTHKLNSISRYLVHDVFKLPPGVRSIPVGYARLACAFAISGLMHLLMDMSIGLTIKTSGGLSFFCTQIAGIMFEDFVLVAYRRFRGYNRSHPSRAPPSRAQKFIGYAWVCAFVVWTLPAYMYPMVSLNNAEGSHAIVPVSLIGLWRGD
jgi:hypothetical protein